MELMDHDANCADAIERLYHYLDGELDDARRQLVKHHLDECLPCLDAFDFEAELRQVIARKCQETVPEQLRVRIALAIQSERGAVDPSREGGIPPL